jgi:hypothetical protein
MTKRLLSLAVLLTGAWPALADGGPHGWGSFAR